MIGIRPGTSHIIISYSLLLQMYFGHGNLTSSISHVVCGVAGLLVLAVTLYRYERHSIEFIYQQFIRPLIKRRTD